MVNYSNRRIISQPAIQLMHDTLAILCIYSVYKYAKGAGKSTLLSLAVSMNVVKHPDSYRDKSI